MSYSALVREKKKRIWFNYLFVLLPDNQNSGEISCVGFFFFFFDSSFWQRNGPLCNEACIVSVGEQYSHRVWCSKDAH